MVRVGAVSYLNTKPLLYGMHGAGFDKKMELILDYPASIAQMLLEDKIDIGLVPVAIIPQMKEWYLNTDFCIGATGEVASVSLFSEVELPQVKNVLLDYQSRTSAALTQVLLRQYWNLDPVIINGGSEDYRKKIVGTTAGLVIGDRALEQRQISTFNYDLATAWVDYSGLPFVFAGWISNKKLPDDWVQEFNAAIAVGMNQLPQVAQQYNFPYYNMLKYFTENISYHLDAEKRAGLDLFLKELGRIKIK